MLYNLFERITREVFSLKSEWRIIESDVELEQILSKKFGINSLLSHILSSRVKNVQEAEELLFPQRIVLGNPYEMTGMKDVVEELIKIRDRKESLVVYGDYDVDGVTGTALYYLILNKWGWNVEYHIPSRLEDGYGLSKETIKRFAIEGKKNFLTVDCGITSVEEIDYANAFGCKIIVTDHHEPKEKIPHATAIVNPKCSDDHYRFKSFSGVGVAYKVVEAIKMRLGVNDDLENYLDIVALGTIADIVPLVGENRYFVYKGLQLLSMKNRVGISALMEVSNVNFENIKTHDVGFRIAPKINAVGRIDNAVTALQLIIEEDPKKAFKFADELVKKNQERQFIENEIYQEAIANLDSLSDFENLKILVIDHKNWHPGVIGIVASRILSMYHKPTLMITIDGDTARGSARSVEGINIIDILGKTRDLLDEFGGHKMAAGFSLKTDKIELFKSRINEIMADYDTDLLKSELLIDDEITLEEVDNGSIDSIENLKPFGNGNPEPVFLIRNLTIEQLKPVGKSSFKMILKSKEKKLEGIGFGLLNMTNAFRFSHGSKKVDVIVNVWKDSWNGSKRYQLNIIDMDVKNEDKIFIKHDHHFDDMELENLDKNGNTLVIGSPNIVEEIIIRMAQKSKKIVVVLPTNSMLADIYNSVCAALGNFNLSIGYVDALHPVVKDEDLIFTNIFSLSRVLKEKSNLIICEPQMMIQSSMFDYFSKIVEKNHPKSLIFFSSFFSKAEETTITDTFNCKIVNIFQKQNLGVIDDRNVSNKMEIIEELIENKTRSAVVFSDVQSLKSFYIKLCKNHPAMCTNREISTYIPNEDKSIELKYDRVNLLLATGSMMPRMEFERIIYYDFPRNHSEFLKPPAALKRGMNMTVQMIFGNDDVQKNMRDLEELFPLPQRIIESAKILKNSSGDMVDVLIHSEMASSKAIAKIYLSILSEISAFNGKAVTRIPAADEIENSLREREGWIEKFSLKMLERDLMNSQVKNIAKIFQNPFEAHEKSSY